MNNHNINGSLAHPRVTLEHVARDSGLEVDDEAFADKLDERDPVRHLRKEFFYPKNKTMPKVDLTLVDPEEDSVYLCGNSLGLEPKRIRHYVDGELDKWAKIGVHGHETGELAWAHCDEAVDEDVAKLVGAKRHEVAVMNGLTVNLHLMMVSFYRPTPTRHKVLLENHAFPSDHYAVESQIRIQGYDPETSMILLKPREGEELLRHEDILDVLEKEGESIATVLLPGVQYYTGQVYDFPTITRVAQDKGCLVGYDLAHAIGNIELFLHDWNVDFAVWCSYKYLNSGAGGIAGAFIHEKHDTNTLPKLLGWWGHRHDTRFKMDNMFVPTGGVASYRISNPSIMMCAALRGSLDVFNMTSMSELREKSVLLTGYMELLLQRRLCKDQDTTCDVTIITPSEPADRGSQLSLKFSLPVAKVYDELVRRGVALDLREPNVLRVAPAPLYNSYADVFRFVKLLSHALSQQTSSTT